MTKINSEQIQSVEKADAEKIESQINMKVSQRLQKLNPSLTLALTAKAKAMKAEGKDVVSFGAGEPDFDTPDFIKEPVIEDLKAGKTKYTPAKGGVDVINAVKDFLKSDYQLDYEPTQIVVSVGGKHSLYNLFQALVDPGDEVIVPAPYWLSYPEQISAADGKSVIVNCGPEDNFKISPEKLEAAITKKTVGVILNSPSNPTGAVYTKDELAALAEVLKKHEHVNIISDDLYMKLVYEPAEFTGILDVAPELKERTIIVNGWSKAYAMTGWRLGWMAGPENFIKSVSSLQSHSTSNVTSFIQRAAAVAISSDHEFLKDWKKQFHSRRDILVNGLNELPGVTCSTPEGAFYAFPDISGVYGKTIQGKEIKGSLDFADVALEKANVSVVPGIAFGEDRCIRMSYATSQKDIEEGLKRLAQILA